MFIQLDLLENSSTSLTYVVSRSWHDNAQLEQNTSTYKFHNATSTLTPRNIISTKDEQYNRKFFTSDSRRPALDFKALTVT